MSQRRLVRINELLKREIAGELYRVVNEAGFDLAAVTVTHVITSPDLRHAKVLVSVREHQGERQEMLRLLEKHRKQIQRDINRNVNIKYTPQLHFELDESLEQGDHVLALLSELGLEDDDHADEEGGDETDEPLSEE